jgi:hypothetical protein
LELPRIVEEYAAEAIAALRPLRPWDSFTVADLRWVVECAATSLPEIEKATLRVVALKISASLSDAARLLGMAPVSLARWLGRRSQPPTANAGLLDFGLARSLTATRASTSLSGTPHYIAPERIRGEPASPASDV